MTQSDDLGVGKDVADGKTSRPWAMHGQPPRRPPGPSTEYPHDHHFPIIFRLYPARSLSENRSLVDFETWNERKSQKIVYIDYILYMINFLNQNQLIFNIL